MAPPMLERPCTESPVGLSAALVLGKFAMSGLATAGVSGSEYYADDVEASAVAGAGAKAVGSAVVDCVDIGGAGGEQARSPFLPDSSSFSVVPSSPALPPFDLTCFLLK